MVTVQTLNTRLEADAAKRLLESRGFHAFVWGDDAGGMGASLAFASGVDLKVDSKDLVEAKKVLSSPSKK